MLQPQLPRTQTAQLWENTAGPFPPLGCPGVWSGFTSLHTRHWFQHCLKMPPVCLDCVAQDCHSPVVSTGCASSIIHCALGHVVLKRGLQGSFRD